MAVPGLDIDEVLPGTRALFTDERSSTSGDSYLEKSGDIILVPQPTQSPNDPLNWSFWRKTWHSVLVCYIVALTAATSNVAGSASTGANAQYGISYNVFNTGAGVLFLAIGYWTLLSSPAVHLYGRRILYIVGLVWGIVGNLWFGFLHNSSDSIWSQLFVGASESVAEAVVQLSLLDIWFEHQNGTSMGVYTLATSIGTYLGPLIGGYIADSSLGYRWIGYFGAIFSGATLVLVFFGLEETSFHRDRYLGPPPQNAASTPPAEDLDEKVMTTTDIEKAVSERRQAEIDRNRASICYSRPKTYWQRIAIITPSPNLKGVGFKQYLKRLWHTMRVFSFPAVWFAGLQWGLQSSALTFYLTVEEDNWTDAPWNYGDAAVGNMNLPCLIGSVIGCFYGGYISDIFMLWMARRNKGVMEAEYRLFLMSLCIIIFPVGMILFGVGSSKGWSWPVPYIGLGFIGFGYGCAGDLSLTYLADCYPDMVLEGMVGVAVINNTLAMMFTFTASDWIDTSMRNTFIELAVISFLILGSAVPMVIWGKKARRWTKYRYLNFLRIRDGMDG